MSKKTYPIDAEEGYILVEAIRARVKELEKIASNLMKKRLVDAATPVYNEIKRLSKKENRILDMLPASARDAVNEEESAEESN